MTSLQELKEIVLEIKALEYPDVKRLANRALTVIDVMENQMTLPI